MRVAIGRVVLGLTALVVLMSTLRPTIFHAQRAPSRGTVGDSVPEWLYPSAPPSASPAVFDSIKPIHLPRVHVAVTETQLHSLYFAPDWDPSAHPAMPEIVAHGRKPALFACAYCHMPDGAGRPENVQLAGLPAAYIVQHTYLVRQLLAFKSGARATTASAPMHTIATALSLDDMIAVAAYAATLTP